MLRVLKLVIHNVAKLRNSPTLVRSIVNVRENCSIAATKSKRKSFIQA